MLDRSHLTTRLEQIEDRISAAERRVTRQLLRLAELRDHGRDTRLTEDFLRSLEGMISVYRSVRAEILARL